MMKLAILGIFLGNLTLESFATDRKLPWSRSTIAFNRDNFVAVISAAAKKIENPDRLIGIDNNGSITRFPH